MDAQVKLLRVIENGEAQPIGARMPLQIDVRVIAATNRKLQEEVDAGRFREDLYYRINVVQLTIPPLRQSNGDITALSRHLTARIAHHPGCRCAGKIGRASGREGGVQYEMNKVVAVPVTTKKYK